jgi:hypothetical protein
VPGRGVKTGCCDQVGNFVHPFYIAHGFVITGKDIGFGHREQFLDYSYWVAAQVFSSGYFPQGAKVVSSGAAQGSAYRGQRFKPLTESMVATGHNQRFGIYCLNAGSNCLDDIDMAGKTSQTNHIGLKPVICVLVMGIDPGIEQQNFMPILFQTRP